MRKTAHVLAAISLSMCLGLSPQRASTAIENSLKGNSLLPSSMPSVTADINDSDEFFQSAIRSRGQQRDYSQKIEALLKQDQLPEAYRLALELDQVRSQLPEAGKRLPALEQTCWCLQFRIRQLRNVSAQRFAPSSGKTLLRSVAKCLQLGLGCLLLPLALRHCSRKW